MKNTLSQEIGTHYQFYPLSHQSDLLLQVIQKKNEESGKHWRKWPLSKGFVDKNGIIQSGTTHQTNLPRIEHEERFFRMMVRSALLSGRDPKEMMRTLDCIQHLTREQLVEILEDEEKTPIPMVRPRAFRIHYPGMPQEFIDYYLVDLPDGSVGDMYCVSPSTGAFMLVSRTPEAEVEEVIQKNHMQLVGPDKGECEITKLKIFDPR